jgi:signal transduction histidine kinase
MIQNTHLATYPLCVPSCFREKFVKLRPKLFLLIFAIAFAGLLLLCLLNYWQETRYKESTLREALRRDADWIALRLTSALNDREASLATLAQNPALRLYLQCQSPPVLFVGSERPQTFDQLSSKPKASLGAESAAKQLPPHSQNAGPKCSDRSADKLPPELEGVLAEFLRENRKYYGPISVFDGRAAPLVRASINQTSANAAEEPAAVSFKTRDLTSGAMGPDGISRFSVEAGKNTLSRGLSERGPLGATVQYTIPVFAGKGDPVALLGAFDVELKLDQLFKEQVSDVIGALNGAPTGLQTSRIVMILHRLGRIFYHSNAPVTYQPVATSMPEFQTVAVAMLADETGARFYQAADNDRWLAAYRPLGQYELSLAVATDFSRAIGPARQALIANALYALVIALLAALPLTLIAQRRSGRSLERLTQGAVAIAGGRLDQELVVSSAENQLLADSVNKVTARLREQLAREAESRQFDSFLRLSAMLTHDLKNAISGLSLLVGNMDRQFDKPEFRADAMESLRDATGKLQKLVTKLSDPINTMSGEHQRPRPTDLVPLLRRVLDSLTSPESQFHTIQVELPPELIAETEAERMEKVIENLVINALEAMGSKSGVLTIGGGAAGAGKVFFTVTDTGPGMSKEFQERRLFHPFATTKHGGVGLGLYTCREVVRAFGGSISATSEPGVGTTFRVVLPSVQPGDQQL